MNTYRPATSLPVHEEPGSVPGELQAWWNYVPLKTYQLSTGVTSICGSPLDPFDVVLVSGIRVSRMKLSRKWVTEPTEVIPSLSNERRAAFRGDGKVLVTCGTTGIHAWNVVNGRPIRSWDRRSSGGTTDVVVLGNQDSKLYSTTADGHILEHDLVSEKTQRRLRAHRGEISVIRKMDLHWNITRDQMQEYINKYSSGKKAQDNGESMDEAAKGDNIPAEGQMPQVVQDNMDEFARLLEAGSVKRVESSFLVTGSYDRMIKVWDIGRGTKSVNYNRTSSLIKEVDFGCEVEALDVWDECSEKGNGNSVGGKGYSSSYIVAAGGNFIKIYKLSVTYKLEKPEEGTGDIDLMPEFNLNLISTTEVMCKGITAIALAANPYTKHVGRSAMSLPFVIVFGAFDGRIRVASPVFMDTQKRIDAEKEQLKIAGMKMVGKLGVEDNQTENMSEENMHIKAAEFMEMAERLKQNSTLVKLHVAVMADLRSTVISLWLCCDKYKLYEASKETKKKKEKEGKVLIDVRCFKVIAGTANNSIIVLDTKDARMRLDSTSNLKMDLLGGAPEDDLTMFGITDDEMKQEKLNAKAGSITQVSEGLKTKKKLKMADTYGTAVSIVKRLDPETKQVVQVRVNKELVIGKINPSENDKHYDLTRPSNEVLKSYDVRRRYERRMNGTISKLLRRHFDTTTLEVAVTSLAKASNNNSNNSSGNNITRGGNLGKSKRSVDTNIDLIAILREMEYSDPFLFRKGLDNMSFKERIQLIKFLISVVGKQESGQGFYEASPMDEPLGKHKEVKNASTNASFCLRILTYLLYVMDIAKIEAGNEKSLTGYIAMIDKITKTMHTASKVEGMVDAFLDRME